jgi:hypothetical protein
MMYVRSINLSLLIMILAASVPAQQSLIAELKSQHDPGKRSEMALTVADELFEGARAYYVKGEISKGDAELEEMTSALNACLESLAAANKSRSYKKAELKVAYLQRRLSGLVDNLNLQERGWAQYTGRKLEEIHDKLLIGVMRK